MKYLFYGTIVALSLPLLIFVFSLVALYVMTVAMGEWFEKNIL